MTTEYFDRIGFATIRREPGDNSDTAMDALLNDYIEMSKQDMIRKGVDSAEVEDEANLSIMGAICSYVRYRFSKDNRDGADNLSEYRDQVDELRKSV